MASVRKPEYIAIVGIDFEGGKRHVRVEAGERIPSDVVQSEDMDALLRDGHVRLKGEDDK